MSYMVKWQAARGQSEIYFDNREDADDWVEAHGGEIWLKIQATVSTVISTKS